MKVTKHNFVMSLLLALSLTLSGCGLGGNTASSSAVAKESSAGTESAASLAASESAIEVEVPDMSSDTVMYGIVLKSTDSSVTVQSDLGNTATFPIQKKTEVSAALTSGSAVMIEYTGKLQNGTAGKKFVVKSIEPSSKKPILDESALSVASEVVLAVEEGNLSKLADVCSFPLIYDNGKHTEIAGRQELISLGRKRVFKKQLVSVISRTNLFMLDSYTEGIMLGRSKPNIVMTVTPEGWKVTGIHYR